ncbi:MAG: hypothetical protein ACR2Q4_20680 [Geminicoccaceae bacterium]
MNAIKPPTAAMTSAYLPNKKEGNESLQPGGPTNRLRSAVIQLAAYKLVIDVTVMARRWFSQMQTAGAANTFCWAFGCARRYSGC